jgi:hypothetical protein
LRSTILAALTALLLAVTLTSAAGAADPADEKADPDLTAATGDAAEDALDDALALVRELPADAARRANAAGGRNATMILNEVLRTRDELSRADRKRANRLLARPTAAGGDGLMDYGTAPNTSWCDDAICIHYVTDGNNAHAPDLTDAGGEPGVPDAVEEALATARSVHDTYLASGYLPPDPDAANGGGTDLVDIYLGDIGDQGVYGYCTSDQPETFEPPWNRWAYCGIDNDFRPGQFPTNSPTENQQVTLAHEYYHAVQYAYDAGEDPWFMEASATWAEEQLFDAVDDNRAYLPYGQLRRPRVPLDEFSDTSLSAYGQWIFFEYLTQRWGDETGSMPTIMLDLWNRVSGRAGGPDEHSTRALQQVLAARGSSFTEVYGQFAAANRHPASTYAEGAAYPRTGPHRVSTLGRGDRRSGTRRARLDHLTHMTVQFRPDRGLRRGDWRLRIRVDLPHRVTAPVAHLVVTYGNGEVVQREIRLSDRGRGGTTTRFRSGSVRYAEVVLVNASRRSRCWTAEDYPVYACYGSPRDDSRRAAYRGWVVRR